MIKKFKIATLALSACMALGVVGFTACGQAGKSAYDIWLEQGNTGTEQDFLDSLKGAAGKDGVGTNGKSAYEIWKEYHPEENLTETQWLESLKGAAGETPEITISDDGYWEINGEKTSQKAQGNDGDMPEITISDDGYWEINGQKTSQKAQGDPGTPGTPGTPGAAGARGNKITKGEGAPASTEGAVENDMYVDTKEWHVYFFEGTEWKDYGSIKGGGSEPEPPTPSEEVVKNLGEMTFTNTETEIDLSNIQVEDNTYLYVVVETTEAASGKLFILANPDTGTNKFDMYSPTKNDYRGFFIKNSQNPKIKTANSSTTITGTVKVVKWSQPTIKANETYEVPANKTTHTYQIVLIDSSLVGQKVNIEIHQPNLSSSAPSGVAVTALNTEPSSNQNLGATTRETGTDKCTLKNVTIPTVALVFKATSLNGANITVKITLAE